MKITTQVRKSSKMGPHLGRILLKRPHFPHCKAFDLQVRKARFRLWKHWKICRMDGCCTLLGSCKISEIMRLKSKAGPIPGDCDYSELRTAFLSHGQTCHLFIQNNQVTILTSYGCKLECSCFRLGLKGTRRSLGPDRLFYRIWSWYSETWVD